MLESERKARSARPSLGPTAHPGMCVPSTATTLVLDKQPIGCAHRAAVEVQPLGVLLRHPYAVPVEPFIAAVTRYH
ncbi:hypothetical protein BaRGS_00017753 [Batillaria attramentaria]|uniref:Uncharacterized protein n=1 Tax=Batillaria attramentaria TaxID=370345 RepID=A0ABD0KUY6_9CAEN